MRCATSINSSSEDFNRLANQVTKLVGANVHQTAINWTLSRSHPLSLTTRLLKIFGKHFLRSQIFTLKIFPNKIEALVILSFQFSAHFPNFVIYSNCSNIWNVQISECRWRSIPNDLINLIAVKAGGFAS